jgi:hypothetical protein
MAEQQPHQADSSAEHPGQTSPMDQQKVGGDPESLHRLSPLDFGIPASKVRGPLPDGGREKGPEQGTGPMRSGEQGVRVTGVGHAPGSPGAGSGGDLDPDVIGLGQRGGLAAAPPSGRTQGPDITEGGSEPFASGPPSRGEHEARPGSHGATEEILHGSTVDRSGGDASTTGFGGGADSASPLHEEEANRIPDNAPAGEVSTGEASGQGG